MARELAPELRPGDRVVLEGEMGAGKSTFARFLLEALGVDRSPEGSPTFPLVHLYPAPRVGEVAHLDLYRLKSEIELEEAGLLEYLWWKEGVVLVEWLSLWPELEAQLRQEAGAEARSRVYRVQLAFVEQDDRLRSVRIWRS